MWLLVLFDLPVTKPHQRSAATRFRNYLLKDGYIMLQFSVYARVCNGDEAAQKHVKRIQDHLPEEGSIRAIQVTDQQYSRMKILLGNLPPEEATGSGQLLLF